MRIAVILAASLALTAAVIRAQSEEDDDENDMDYFPLVPSGKSLQFGLRYVGGPKVTFKNVGTVPIDQTLEDTISPVDRVYDDGYVSVDSRQDSYGNPANDGLTNTWNYNYTSQVTSDGDIAMHLYNTTSLGTILRAKNNTAAGWELRAAKKVAKLGRKIDLSLMAGFTFSEMNAKSKTNVLATLTTMTDVYSLYGQDVPSAAYTGPTSTTVVVYDANGNPVLGATGSAETKTVDTSTLISSTPTSRTYTTSTAYVKGRWQVRGGYYTLRAGPVIQIPYSERLKFTVSAGAGVMYVGAKYEELESILIDDTLAAVIHSEEKNHSVFMPAFFVDADAEYWMTERTGVYMGATYQVSRRFNVSLSDDSSATIDFGTTSGIRSGVTLRF